jgi:uncharacterized protein (DUF362 family)
MRDRREFLKAAIAASLAPSLSRCTQPEPLPEQPWLDTGFRKTDRSAVAVLTAAEYDGRLVDVVRRGIELFGIDVRGKRVALKPNFVEFDPASAINTNPILIASTIEAFRHLGAASVTVAEGPGHRRDNEYVLRASGLLDTLRDASATYVDLNVDTVRPVAARSRYTRLGQLYIGETVANADLLVSMPKMKTHHWAGVTLSLKNMFGIMPGAIYGWPKNVLHFAGIENSILDINAALAMPRFNIVDGIVGMEGNGPIQGSARRSGVLVFGVDPVAVDATASRLMGVEPSNVWYLAQADRFLGNIADDRIDQRGEALESLAQDYALIETMHRLRPRLTGSG